MAHAQEQPAITTPSRSGRWRIRLARAGWLVIVVLITGIFIASAPTATLYQRRDWQFAEALPAVWPYMSTFTFAAVVVAARLAALAVFYAVALLIARRKWDDWFALFVSAALLMVAFVFIGRGDITTYVFPVWLGPIGPILSIALPAVFTMSWLLLFYLLPDGRFVPRWSAWFIPILILGAVLLAVSDNLPRLIPPQDRAMVAYVAWGGFIISLLIALMAGLFAQLYRYRRVATTTQRQQMKWILLGLAVQPLFIFFSIGGLASAGPRAALFNLFFGYAVITLLPITIGLAVFRRRLWDVDPLINRSLVYGGLTLLVLLLYVALVGLAFVLFGETSNLLLAAFAVGIAALLAQPIRTRLQRAVNRLMYGDRDDPATVLARLSDRLATAAAPGETLPLLVETVAQALKLPYVAVESSDVEGRAILAESGRPQPAGLRLPLVYQSAPVGEFIVAGRSPEESFTPAERRLLAGIAQQAGAAVYAAQLTDHLQRSREELVLAREEERRRLQRDLHDGLGPQLATLSMQIDVARNLVAADSPNAAALLAKLSAETQAAIADIRRLVYDLRPPSLDQLGLIGALREYVAGQSAAAGPRVTVEAPPDLPPLPAAVEVAAYRIAQEAVANCLHHAAAGICRITLRINGGLSLEIRDDGRGLPKDIVPGVGLTSMRERAAELGGECRIESLPDGGTRVSATFPLPKSAQQ